MNYKEDKSFFTLLRLPTPMNLDYLVKWFFQNPQCRYRLILDDEINDQYMSLRQIHELYPGIKTIAVVSNPWERIYHGYQMMVDCIENDEPHWWLDEVDCNNGFDAYVESCLALKTYKKLDFWWNTTTQHVEWLEYINDSGKIEKVDYIFRAEEISKQIQPLKEFFESDIDFVEDYVGLEYRNQYSDKSRELVATTFKDDIARFGYEF